MKNLSMIVKFFIAFSLFLAIPLTFAGFIFNYNIIRYSETEISKSVISNLETIKSMNDIIIDSISKDTIRLSVSHVFDDIHGVDDYYVTKNNVSDIIKLNRIARVINETVSSNNRIDSMYFYIDSANYIISSKDGVMPKSGFSDLDWMKEYVDKKRQVDSILWLNNRIISDAAGDENVVNVITYILPLTALSLDLNGALVVNISENELSKTINLSNFTSDGSVSIINNEGKVISHKDKTFIGKNISSEPYIKKIINGTLQNGYYIENIHGKKQIVAYYKAKMNGWIYVGVFSLDDLMAKAYSLRVQTFSVLVAILVLGILISYLMSRKLYSPLNSLIQDVKKRKGIDLKDTKNELDLLSKAFVTISQQEDTMIELLEKNKRNLEEKYLINILKGVTEEDNANILHDFTYKYYLCAVVSIDKFERFNERYPHDQHYYLKMLILRVTEEALNHSSKCRGILYDSNKIVAIINTDNEFREKSEQALRIDFHKIQLEISKVLDNTITIAYGRCYPERSNIKDSFNEAQDALKKRLIFGHGNIIEWGAESTEANKYYYPYVIEKHIFNNLGLGMKEETIAAIEELVRDIKNRDYLSPDNILQIFIQIVGNTVKHLVDKNINTSDIFGNEYNIYQKLSTKETIDEIEAWLKGFYSGIMEYSKDSESQIQNNSESVLDFIRKNYASDIDVTAIADYAGISYSYVRKIVKEKTGKSVVDYVNGLRIEEAKRLLRQTNLNIIEIATNIGYNNDQSFNRFFKKYEGITPGEFRSIC